MRATTTQSKVAWAEDRAPQRCDPSAAPGAKTGAGATSCDVAPLLLPLRDWHQSEKSSRHEAAKSSTGRASQLANANPSKFQFPLNQDSSKQLVWGVWPRNSAS